MGPSSMILTYKFFQGFKNQVFSQRFHLQNKHNKLEPSLVLFKVDIPTPHSSAYSVKKKKKKKKIFSSISPTKKFLWYKFLSILLAFNFKFFLDLFSFSEKKKKLYIYQF